MESSSLMVFKRPNEDQKKYDFFNQCLSLMQHFTLSFVIRKGMKTPTLAALPGPPGIIKIPHLIPLIKLNQRKGLTLQL